MLLLDQTNIIHRRITSFRIHTMNSLETYESNPINRQEWPEKSSGESDEILSENFSLRTELEVLYLIWREREERFLRIEKQQDEVLKQNSDLIVAIKEVSSETDYYRDEIYKVKDGLQEREDELWMEKEKIKRDVDDCNDKIKELLKEKSEIIRVFSDNLEVIKLIKEGLGRATESLEEDEAGSLNKVYQEKSDEQELDGELVNFLRELKGVSCSVNKLELKLKAYKEKKKKERKELENSVTSLTEENRDANSLLRIALVEKQAVERRLNKLKGNNEHGRSTIFQIAERGLQRVGFGFMVGAATNEQSPENSSSFSANTESSECEEEVVSLASTMDKIMKKLRLEITQLKMSLDESRSETERLLRLTEQQSNRLAENMTYIKELEDRELIFTQNIEQLHKQIKENEEEVARWREACELEVEAGKNAIKEYEKLVDILKQELVKVKTDLDISNGKLKMKDELVATAIAAREAAERSLQLADSRVAGLHSRIEKLTRELEAADERGRPKRTRVRRICWPWQALKLSTANTTTNRNVKQLLPEMQALLL